MIMPPTSQLELISSTVTAVGVVVAAGALIVNVFQLREQARFNRLTHKLQAFATLHDSFMRLSIRRNEAVRRADREEVEQIFREYFSRQFAHWDFYLNGIQEQQTLVDWLYAVFDVMRGWYDLGYARSDYIWPAIGRSVVRTNVRLTYVLESIAHLARDYPNTPIDPSEETIVRGKLREFLQRSVVTKDEKVLLFEIKRLAEASA